jgi:hypothetical protein
VANPERLAGFHQPGDELVMDRTLHEYPRTSAAHLPAVVEDSHRRRRHRKIEVSIGEDDVRRFSAQFHRHLLHGTRRCLDDLLPGSARSGERDLVDIRML